AVGQAGECYVATPRQSPHAFARNARIRRDRSSRIQSDTREILNMLRDQEAARFEKKNSQIAFAFAIDLFGDIKAVHSGSDYDGIKRKAAIADGLVIRVADVAPQYVQGKSSFLYFDGARSFLEIADHRFLLPAGCLAGEE